MPESLSHQKLKLEGKQLLLSKGYSEDKILVDKKYIEVEWAGQKYKFRIDVYASNSSEIALECGNFPKWKKPIYEQYFGKEHVIHFPYPKNYGKYLISDIQAGQLNKMQATQFLIDSYKKYIFQSFKEDPIFDFQEFKEETRNTFDVDNHRTYLEINPDYSDKEETRGRDVWMNFPNAMTLSKSEYKDVIHWGMVYYTKNKVGVVTMLSGKSACEKFLNLSKSTHKKIFDVLKILPPNFFIRDGYSFWDKFHQPPLDKAWNTPVPCHELTWEDYEKILENLENLIRLQKTGHKVGPILDLAKVFCEDSELPAIIEEFRELYSILLKPETKYDVIAENIKKMESWEWYVERRMEWGELHESYRKKFGDDVLVEDFKKACKKLRFDPDFVEYIKD
jgi:hypothetical protein